MSVFCCGGKVNFVRIPYSHDRFSKISRTFFVKKIPYETYVREDQLFLALYGSTTIQSLLFLKNIKNFIWFLNNTYWVSLFLRNNSLIFRTGVSCFSVTLFYSTLFCCGGKANLVRFTLSYSTLLTLTDRMTDRGTNTLASRGLEEPAHASRGLEELFFQLCCCVMSVFGSGGKCGNFLYIIFQRIVLGSSGK